MVIQLSALIERTRASLPVTITGLIELMEGSLHIVDFRQLVHRFLPGHELRIMGEPGDAGKIGTFMRLFEERYFPLVDDPYFMFDSEEPLVELMSGIPAQLHGFSDDDYHQIPDMRLGIQIMSTLFDLPYGDGHEDGEAGGRMALLDSVLSELAPRPKLQAALDNELKRIPEGGFPHEVVAGRCAEGRWQAVGDAARWWWQATDNAWLDYNHETVGWLDWHEDTVEALTHDWPAARAILDRVHELAGLLEQEPLRLREIIDHIWNDPPETGERHADAA